MPESAVAERDDGAEQYLVAVDGEDGAVAVAVFAREGVTPGRVREALVEAYGGVVRLMEGDGDG